RALVVALDGGRGRWTGAAECQYGTVTKSMLHMFTTRAMVQTGKVVSNLMVDVSPGNVKLRDRAVRIIRELTGLDEPIAKAALEKSGWVVKQALRRLRPSA